MKIKNLISVVLVAILAIGSVNLVSAQENNGSGKEEVQDARKTRLQQDSIKFENATRDQNRFFDVFIEQNIICKGETTRVKFMVDPSCVLKFEVLMR